MEQYTLFDGKQASFRKQDNKRRNKIKRRKSKHLGKDLETNKNKGYK